MSKARRFVMASTLVAITTVIRGARLPFFSCYSLSSSSPLLVGRTFSGASEFCKLGTVRTTCCLRKNFPMSSSQTNRYSTEGVVSQSPLVKRKCISCSTKDLQPITEEAAKDLLEQIPEWELLEIDGKLQLQRCWKAKNFLKGLDFIKSIANVAEAEGHHPDLHLVNWNDVKANIWTHSVGGVTENDFILAAKINALDTDGFLRKTLSQAKPPPPKPPPAAI